jgi:hypothetical protein
MADRFGLSIAAPTIWFLSSMPISKKPPSLLAKAQTSSESSRTLPGTFSLNSTLYPSPLLAMDFISPHKKEPVLTGFCFLL